MGSDAIVNICTYRVRNGARAEFVALLKRLWPTLHAAGLVADMPPLHFEFVPEDDEPQTGAAPTFVEIFSWKASNSAELAHRSPEVMAIWEPTGALVEDRGGRPGMEFPMFRPLKLV